MADSCYSPGLLPVNEALDKMLETVLSTSPSPETETLALLDATGRILAKDVISAINVPPCDNSAMDGYALRAEDLSNTDELLLVGKAMAGNPYSGTVEHGQCVRIMTGAPIPKGANCVVMQENAVTNDQMIKFSSQPPKYDNVRFCGESVTAQDIVATKGTLLNAANIGLLASLGEAAVTVFKRLKIGVMATGDELSLPGVPLETGQIYESNRVMVMALLKQFGADVKDYGIVADEPEATKQALLEANKECDLVITSGGVSVGEADFVKSTLEQIGKINFWKVAIKPGKPFAFGRLPDAWFCGLPGNPVSSYVTCQQLVIPLLMALQNQSIEPTLTFNARASADIRKQPGRMDFQRGICRVTEKGEIEAKANGPQGSGIMTSVANANCYIVLDAEQGNVEAGAAIKIIPFSSLIS